MNDPKTFLERTEVASSCAKKLHFTMPMLIDDMKGATLTASILSARMARLFIREVPGPGVSSPMSSRSS